MLQNHLNVKYLRLPANIIKTRRYARIIAAQCARFFDPTSDREPVFPEL